MMNDTVIARQSRSTLQQTIHTFQCENSQKRILNPVVKTTRFRTRVASSRIEKNGLFDSKVLRFSRNDVLTSVLFSGNGHPAWNMAVDETLLRHAQQSNADQLFLRFYGWDRPSTSIGYFQKFDQFQCGSHVIRRPTGGGVVQHQTDLTYSMIFPEDLFGRGCAYAFIHKLIRGVLMRWPQWHEIFLIPEQVATRGKITRCFEQPSAHDLVLRDKKLAGAAQRRSKGWILHQGSLQMGADARNAGLRVQIAAGITSRLEGWLEKKFTARELNARQTEQAKELFENRYSTDAWNKKF